VDTSVTYNYEENNVIVKFSIKENRHYRINQLVYNGLENISDVAKKEIKKIELIKKGNFYNRVLIIQHTNIIADALQNNGYMHAREKQDSGIVIQKYDSEVIVNINFTGADTIYKFGKTGINILQNKYGVGED